VAREGIVAVLEWLVEAGSGETVDPADRVNAALGGLGFSPVTRDELTGIVADEVKAFDMAGMREPEATHRYMMGILMEKLTGRVEGGRVSRMLEAQLKSASGV
jgi:Glu-tRNA(Gln) amidotransferase subunit E-like FAD-binding protein